MAAGMQKIPAIVLSARGHTKDIGVKLFRALHVTDIQNDMVHPRCPDHRFLLLLAR
jgi:hypothetical protein